MKKLNVFRNLKIGVKLGSAFTVMVLFMGASYKVFTSVRLGEGTECELGYPLWPARLMVMIGLGLLSMVQVASFLRKFKSDSS